MKRAKGKRYPRYEDSDLVSRVASGAFQIRRATVRDREFYLADSGATANSPVTAGS